MRRQSILSLFFLPVLVCTVPTWAADLGAPVVPDGIGDRDSQRLKNETTKPGGAVIFNCASIPLEIKISTGGNDASVDITIKAREQKLVTPCGSGCLATIETDGAGLLSRSLLPDHRYIIHANRHRWELLEVEAFRSSCS
ncbi:hypothetical protein [Phaeospirillum tilakii]|uniref:Uncharacterized protein n=1 Tax=Phaeospirillum tilakii TaxID=741673 RepID=A0ABW5CB76_9PROT